MIEYLVLRGYDDWNLATIPAPLAFPIFVAIYECRMSPPSGWKKEAYLVIGKGLFTYTNSGVHVTPLQVPIASL
jgi:hypothetical protein